MPNLQAGVDLNLIDSTPLELQKGALDASLYGRHIHANPDCRIKNVNYQRSVEAAITTAMEITTSNPSDAKCTSIKRRNDSSSLIPNATSCCHYNKDKDKSVDENYFLQGTS